MSILALKGKGGNLIARKYNKFTGDIAKCDSRKKIVTEWLF